MPRYLARRSIPEIVSTLKDLKVEVGNDLQTRRGKWAIHPDIPAKGTLIYVVDPQLLCAGTSFLTYKVTDIGYETKVDGFKIPKKSLIAKLTAKVTRKLEDYDDEIEVELIPGYRPSHWVLGAADPFSQTECFFDRTEAIAYAQSLLDEAQKALNKAA